MFFSEIGFGVFPVTVHSTQFRKDGSVFRFFRVNLRSLVSRVGGVERVRVCPLNFGTMEDVFPDGSRELVLDIRFSGSYAYVVFPFWGGVRPCWFVRVVPVVGGGVRDR